MAQPRSSKRDLPMGYVPPDETPPPGFAVSGKLVRRAGFAAAGLVGTVAIAVVVGVVTMCLLPVVFVVGAWLLDPEARDRPLITGPGFDDAVSLEPRSD